MASSGLGHLVIDSAAGEPLLVASRADVANGTAVSVALRPEKIEIDTEASRVGSENRLTGRVVEVGYLGDTSIYKIKLDSGLDIRATVANRARVVARPIRTGDRVWLSFLPEAGVVLTQ